MGLDTPDARKARDEAAGIQPVESEPAANGNGHARKALTAAAPPGWKRIGPRAMVASAARINLNDQRALVNNRRRRQAWQSEAWDYADEVPELGYAFDFVSNIMSKLRLFPAVRLRPADGPVAVDHQADPDDDHGQQIVGGLRDLGITPKIAELAIATLARLKSIEGGQSAILRELSYNLEVCGEGYLHGHAEQIDTPDPDDPRSYSPDGAYPMPQATDVEDWQIRSVDELIVTGDTFSLRLGPGVTTPTAIPKTDLVIRIWQRHGRFSELSASPTRRILANCESLLLLDRAIRSDSKSRLSNGILLIPSELSYGPPDPTRDSGDGEETDDPFDAELRESMTTPIQEEGAASAVMPLILRGPAEYLKYVEHLALDKSLDPVIEHRIELEVLRIARGLNLPVEVVQGSMATTFSNQVQIRRSIYEDHIEPRATTMVNAITSGYFQWALEEAGVDASIAHQIFVWFDPADVITTPDQAEMAPAAHKDMLISDAAYRRYLGYSEADAPTNDEKLLRLVLNSPRMDPTLLGQILIRSTLFPDLRVNAPAAGILGDVEPVSSMPNAAPAAPVAAAITAAAAPKSPGSGRDGWAKLGATLAGIDRNLRTRITGALDQALRAALTTAGNRIKTKVQQRGKGGEPGPLARAANSVPAGKVAETLGRKVVEEAGLSDGQLLDKAFALVLGDVAGWMTAAFEAALAAVEKVAGPTPPAKREQLALGHADSVARASEWLAANLHALAGRHLYGTPGAPPQRGETDSTILIPASLVRAAVAVAGGTTPKGGTAVGVAGGAWMQMEAADTVTDADGNPVGGIATGPQIMGVVQDAGASTEGYQWDWGDGVRSEFQPHLDLDGVVAADMSDFEWPDSYDGWPENDPPFPGDHVGCFPAGTEVSGPGPTAATLRYWEGEMVTVGFVSGQFLSATPNHPILTTRGWVGAGHLDEGDEIVRCTDGEGITGLVPNGYQMPARIEEVADAFGMAGQVTTATVKVASHDFHSDGVGSKIAVVRTDRDLRDRVDAALGKPTGQPNLAAAHPEPGVNLAGEGRPAESLETVGAAALSLERPGRHLPAPLGGPASEDESLRLGDSPDTDTETPQAFGDRDTVDAERIGQSLDGLAGFVTTDKVLFVKRSPFSAHVYNLDTRVGWYLANGVIVSNCTCDIIPVLVGPEGDTATETPDNGETPPQDAQLPASGDEPQSQSQGAAEAQTGDEGAVTAADLKSAIDNLARLLQVATASEAAAEVPAEEGELGELAEGPEPSLPEPAPSVPPKPKRPETGV